MPNKYVFFLVSALAIAGPYLLTTGKHWWSTSSAAVTSAAPATPATSHAVAPAAVPAVKTEHTPGGKYAPAESANNSLTPNTSTLEGVPVQGLDDVFRFDITTGWIISRWPRVSAGLSQLELQGYRVPLVTGTAEDDLAGSLTYYFNPRQEVQRITFLGTTGDPRKLVQMLVSRFGFGRRLTNDPRLFRYEVRSADRAVRSNLDIRPAKVVRATQQFQRFEITLSIERPEPN